MRDALEGDAEIFVEGGMQINLVNEVSLTDAQMQTILAGLTKHGAKVASKYGLGTPVLSYGAYTPMPTILLTERLPKNFVLPSGAKRALAYRVVEDGLPTVYASLRQLGIFGKIFGRYRKLATREIMANGYITVLAHELSEMLVAPLLDQFTLPDSAGKSWRKEVCDPVLGAYYAENINGQMCVFPDFVLKPFWDYNGIAPYSYLGSKVGPMIWKVGTYAWFRSAVVRLLRVQF